jgi:hypothetical protein
MNILIATSKWPKKGEEDTFTWALRDEAERLGLQLLAIKGCPGPSCYNLAIKVQGPDKQAEQFANLLCGINALGPIARWTTTSDPVEGFTYESL